MIDNYWEHSQHDTYDPKCSECYKESRIIKEGCREESKKLGFTNHNILKGGLFGKRSSWDINPLG